MTGSLQAVLPEAFLIRAVLFAGAARLAVRSDQAFVRSLPQKKTATVPGPVWLPMTVPMS